MELYSYNIRQFLLQKLDIWSRENDFILKDCLFGALKLTKNPDPDKYSYSE